MKKNKTVIITVEDGVSEVLYAPSGIRVVTIDYDKLESGIDYCPACGEYFEESFPEDGICSSCEFDINDPVETMDKINPYL